MAASNAGSGWAPKNGRPPIRNAGVPGTPIPSPNVLSARTAAASAGSATSRLNRVMFRPSRRATDRR